jgi:multicomponent Na+:H+ antiporter subunit D
MIGVPPAAGFVSKWYLALGSIEAKELPILMVLLVSTILNAAYFLPITYKAFFESDSAGSHHGDHSGHGHDHVRELPMIAVPLALTAVISLVLGVYPDYFLTLAREVIK